MSRFSRVKIILLLFLGTLAVTRLFMGPLPPPGAVVLSDLDVRELAQESFQVSESTQVLIDAVGSVDEREEATGLAAYAWITEGGNMVWSMNDAKFIQEGSLASVENETLVLDPGRYTLHFASYGQLQLKSRPPFQRDQRKWNVILYSPDGRKVLRGNQDVPKKNTSHLIWDVTALEGDEKRERFLEVHYPTDFTIRAIGQLGTQGEVHPLDYSRIEDAVNGRTVWQLSLENTTWAGGVQENRIFDNQLPVEPGLYQAIAVTNIRHHYDGWVGNPPFDPAGWGLRLSTSDPEAVSIFDPWRRRNPVIRMTEVGDDQRHERSFTVTNKVAVLFYALGEINRREEYDVAWLEQVHASGETVTRWRMSSEGSLHAGGARKNRKEVVLLRLEPARYTLYYESDGSHSYDQWNAGEPDYPERWGVTMFPVASEGAKMILVK